MQRLKMALPSSGSILDFLSDFPLHLGRAYDAYVPAEFRDTLSQGLPALFAYPYVCKIERVYRAADGQVLKTLAAPARMNGVTFEMRADAIIRPGMILLATRPELGVDVACRNLQITIQPGTQVTFLRGSEHSQKVLEVRGSARLIATDTTLAGFSFPWGDVGLSFGKVPTEVQYRVNGARTALEFSTGQTEVIWNARPVTAPAEELLHIFASPSAVVKLHHKLGDTETVNDLGPKRQASFLANGQISGTVGAFRGAGGAGGGGAAPAVAGGAGMGAKAAAEPPAGLTITNANQQLRTEGAAIDVMLEWRYFPGNRVLACDIDMAADPELRKILAKYKSADMRLILQGMRPGIYYWRVACPVDGIVASSGVGKISVQDGRRTARVPILLNPPNRSKISGTAVTYTWEKVDGAHYYVLQLSRDATFVKSNEYLAKQGPGLKMNLKKKGVYYWRVYGITGESKEQRTGASATWSFVF